MSGENVDPLYFVAQIILFPIGALLFGIFLRALALELATHGYVVSPRLVWQSNICLSSFTFCLLLLDPFNALDILRAPWRLFFEYIITSFVLNSAGCTFYMYVIVLSKRHLSKGKVPPLFTNIWIASCVLPTLVNCVTSLVGAIIDSRFWFGIACVMLTVQELLLAVIVNVSLHKMGQLLQELELHASSNIYKSQRRKLWILRILTTLLVIADNVQEFSNEDSYLYTLSDQARPIEGYNPQVFDASAVLDSVFLVLAHLILLYALHRPTESPGQSKMVTLAERSRSNLSSL